MKLFNCDIDRVDKNKNKYHNIAGKQIYTLDMYLDGCSFYDFKIKAKKQLLSSVSNLADVEFISVQFREFSLDFIEIDRELSKYRRFRDEYNYCGKVIPFEIVNEWIKSYSRGIFLDGVVVIREG